MHTYIKYSKYTRALDYDKGWGGESLKALGLKGKKEKNESVKK